MSQKKKITIDDLAIMVNKGFQKTHNLIEINAKKIDLNAKKIDLNAKKIDNLSERMRLIEKEVKDIRVKFSKSLSIEEFFELEKRITIVEEKLSIKY